MFGTQLFHSQREAYNAACFAPSHAALQREAEKRDTPRAEEKTLSLHFQTGFFRLRRVFICCGEMTIVFVFWGKIHSG